MQILCQRCLVVLLVLLGVGCADVRKETLKNISFQADSASVLLYTPDSDLKLKDIGIPIIDREEWNYWIEFATSDEEYNRLEKSKCIGEFSLWRKGGNTFNYYVYWDDSSWILKYTLMDSTYYNKVNEAGSIYIRNVFTEISQKEVPRQALKKLDWILGEWEGGDEKGKFIESWKANGKEGYIGAGMTIDSGDTTFTEHLSLRNIEGKVYYIPIVEHNDGPVRFELTQLEERLARFENKDHDFPNRIIYRKVNDRTLHVRVEGDTEEGVKGFDLELYKEE